MSGDTALSKAPRNRDQLLPLLAQASGSASRLGDILVSRGFLSSGDLNEVLESQRHQPGKRIGEMLIASGKLTETQLYAALAERIQVPFVVLADFDFDPAAIALLTPELARRYGVVPLFIKDDLLVVATDDPGNTDVIDVLSFATGHIISLTITTPEEIDYAISTFYTPFDEANVQREAQRLAETADVSARHKNLLKEAMEKPVVRLVHNIFLDAARRRASDIHIRPREKEADLIFRIDGTLIPVRTFSKAMLVTIVNRIKIIGGMDISERRLPQDGRARINNRGHVIDLRLSVIPATQGESVVIRLLDTAHGMRELNEIGFNSHDEQSVRNLLHQNQGLILVTGPTGSGKSTTLYAALQEVQSDNVNIITVEDPVEYHLDGVNQIQVNPRTGYTFAKALRHILRHDPDVIMVGEVRDVETAHMAVESALTGHLVLTTLHTNSAATTITRLLEIGIDAYLVNSTLSAVLAQRLVRLNCPHCKREEKVDDNMRVELDVSAQELFYKGQGCDKCFGVGYRGRRAVYELLTLTPELRALIKPGAEPLDIETLAIEQGMRPLTQQALELAREGLISLDEVFRIRLN